MASNASRSDLLPGMVEAVLRDGPPVDETEPTGSGDCARGAHRLRAAIARALPDRVALRLASRLATGGRVVGDGLRGRRRSRRRRPAERARARARRVRGSRRRAGARWPGCARGCTASPTARAAARREGHATRPSPSWAKGRRRPASPTSSWSGTRRRPPPSMRRSPPSTGRVVRPGGPGGATGRSANHVSGEGWVLALPGPGCRGGRRRPVAGTWTSPPPSRLARTWTCPTSTAWPGCGRPRRPARPPPRPAAEAPRPTTDEASGRPGVDGSAALAAAAPASVASATSEASLTVESSRIAARPNAAAPAAASNTRVRDRPASSAWLAPRAATGASGTAASAGPSASPALAKSLPSTSVDQRRTGQRRPRARARRRRPRHRARAAVPRSRTAAPWPAATRRAATGSSTGRPARRP